MDLKAIYQKYKKVLQPALYCKNRILGLRIHNKGKNNTVQGIGQCRIKKSRISVNGDNNKIIINDMSSLFEVNVSIVGSNNTILIGERNYLEGCSFCVEDDHNTITLGSHVYIYSDTEISAIESTEVSIGNDCLFSANIMIRTGDSHVIMDETSGKRLNYSESICFADKVWLGNGCKVLKGSKIGAECVVGTGALVTHKTPVVNHSVLAGVPAKVVSTGIKWSQQR
ncbi:acyltransferase [Ruminococcus sp.]|uniref:acyltransferase n=1 Tax=Ruminococcus sp. TaxID=41978 RepID=UPI003890FA6A